MSGVDARKSRASQSAWQGAVNHVSVATTCILCVTRGSFLVQPISRDGFGRLPGEVSAWRGGVSPEMSRSELKACLAPAPCVTLSRPCLFSGLLSEAVWSAKSTRQELGTKHWCWVRPCFISLPPDSSLAR